MGPAPSRAGQPQRLAGGHAPGRTGWRLWQWRQAENARRNETVQLRRAEAALARSSFALAEADLREGNSPAVQAALETVPPHLRNATFLEASGSSPRRRCRTTAWPCNVGTPSPDAPAKR